MDKYTNDHGKECYKGVTAETEFNVDLFHKPEYQGIDDDQAWALHTNLGSLTVLNRMTGYGFGVRDIETGFRAPDGDFWLASCNRDVRASGCKTIGEAIEWVKVRANTCNPHPSGEGE